MTSEADDGIQSKSGRAKARVEQMVARTGVGVPRVPCWEPGWLPMPNVFLAASVFGVALPQAPPVVVRRAQLEASPGYTVQYSGRLLTQTHADLVMALMSLARGSERGARVAVRASDLERTLVHKAGRRNRESLAGLLLDISEAHLTVRWGTSVLYGSPLPFGRLDGDVHTLSINQDLMELVQHGFTLIDLDVRRRLARKPLAQWLQLYTGWQDSHAVRGVDLSEVRRVSRSSLELRKLRWRTRNALDAIGEAGGVPWQLGPDDKLRAA